MSVRNYYFLILISFIFYACCDDDSETNCEERNDCVECLSTYLDAVTGDAVAGTALLTRTSSDISVDCTIDHLTPGYVYTLWWVVWNKPSACAVPYACELTDVPNSDEVEVEVLYAVGDVIGESGRGHFSASLSENDNSGSVNDILGLNKYGGMFDAETAEVHLILRSHGPTIEGEIDDQLSTYMGGCINVLPSFTENPDAEGECADLGWAIFRSDCGK